MRKLQWVMGLLILCCAPAAGQAPDSWNNLEGLAVGERVRVVRKDKSSHTGTFVAFSSEAVTLRSEGADTGHRREDVVRVWRVGAARRGRAALIGLAIGAGVGAAVGAASDDEFFTRKAGAAIVGLVGGVVGAGVGAAVARASRSEVYRAPQGTTSP
ncbi:MAG: hypothetical protein ACRD5G_02065 [Candidatus Acidiferrales bacterium]